MGPELYSIAPSLGLEKGVFWRGLPRKATLRGANVGCINAVGWFVVIAV